MQQVSLRSVTKTYFKGNEAVNVLSDVNLDINEHDFVALMGPSGSGKTTILNLIGGLDHPTSGEVVVGDSSLNSLSGGELANWRAQNIGFVFQFYNLLPVLSAQRNVELPLMLTKLKAKERKQNALTALDIVGLADRSKHRPSELSGGQQQRVAIARAIVADPAILVCDEPTGDLDRETAEEILNLLGTLNTDHGKTVVMVTHDSKAAEHAKSVKFLDKGQLVSNGN